jgi:NAD(P)-dependent dehydrogenase (short-subunit alcohol dehydrogenase family)
VGELDGKVAMVTGGGSGIGAAVAQTFAAEGASVAITGRRPTPLADVAARIAAMGGVASDIPADVTDLDAMQHAVDATVERFGRLDVVVANAGAAPPMAPVLSSSLDEWQAIVDVNLTGVFITAKTSVPALRASGGGTIVVMGSGAGRANTGGLGSYSAAKAGLTALCRVLAAELRPENIAGNELIPGPVRTPALDRLTSGGQERATASRVSRRAASDPCVGAMPDVLPSNERPVDATPVHTGELPATPQRDRRIPATAWIEAPRPLLELGADIGEPVVGYLRRIGPWLLWRAGPPSRGDARYMALSADDLSATWTFRVFPDGSGEGTGPDGVVHHRFRTWKEALRDAGKGAAQ